MNGESDPWETWFRDLVQREARGEVQVEWSRAREPDCVHSGRQRQPASGCSICKYGDRFRGWQDYWRSLGAPIRTENP